MRRNLLDGENCRSAPPRSSTPGTSQKVCTALAQALTTPSPFCAAAEAGWMRSRSRPPPFLLLLRIVRPPPPPEMTAGVEVPENRPVSAAQPALVPTTRPLPPPAAAIANTLNSSFCEDFLPAALAAPLSALSTSKAAIGSSLGGSLASTLTLEKLTRCGPDLRCLAEEAVKARTPPWSRAQWNSSFFSFEKFTPEEMSMVASTAWSCCTPLPSTRRPPPSTHRITLSFPSLVNA